MKMHTFTVKVYSIGKNWVDARNDIDSILSMVSRENNLKYEIIDSKEADFP